MSPAQFFDRHARFRFTQKADDLLVAVTLLHVQSPSTRLLDSRYSCYSISGERRLYEHQGQYEQAESFYKRALQIVEGTLTSHHPSVVTTLESMVGLYRTTGREEEAEQLARRVATLREREQ